MAIGARIRQGDSGLIQIDPEWECLCLKEGPVTISVPAGGSGDPIGKTTITSTGCNEPIIALACGSSFVGVLSKTQSGTTFTWQIVTRDIGASVTYWIFDTTDVAALQFPVSYGMRIKKESNGRVVFDSRYKYMRILQLASATAGTASSDISISASSQYAVGISNTGLYTIVSGGPVGGGPSWLVNYSGFVTGFRTNSNGTLSIILIRLALSI